MSTVSLAVTAAPSLTVEAHRAPAWSRPFCVEFEGVEPRRMWGPILVNLLVSFAPLSTRSKWEVDLAAEVLEVVLSAAECGIESPRGYAVIKITPPGDWRAELAGKTGIIATLRASASKGGSNLHASEVAVTRKWLAAVYVALHREIAPEPRPRTWPWPLKFFGIVGGEDDNRAGVSVPPLPAQGELGGVCHDTVKGYFALCVCMCVRMCVSDGGGGVGQTSCSFRALRTGCSAFTLPDFLPCLSCSTDCLKSQLGGAWGTGLVLTGTTRAGRGWTRFVRAWCSESL